MDGPVSALPIALLIAAAVAFAGCQTQIRTPSPDTTASAADDDPNPAAMNSGSAMSVEDAAEPTGESRSSNHRVVEYTTIPWSFASYEGRLITTDNYHIYTTIDHERTLAQLPLLYESALEQYLTAFGPLPDPQSRFKSYLFQDRRQWQAKTRQILPNQSDLFMRLGRGGFTTRGVAILYYIDYGNRPRDTFAIAAHEGWHQYTQRTFRHHLPIWLEEGIATYMEGCKIGVDGQPYFSRRNSERWRMLRETVRRDQMIPLTELLRRTPQSFLEDSKNNLLVYYAQVWALVHFLHDGNDGAYFDGLHELLQDASKGRLIQRLADVSDQHWSRRSQRIASTRIGLEAVYAYFTEDMTAFEQQYIDYVENLVGHSVGQSRRVSDANGAVDTPPAQPIDDAIGDSEHLLHLNCCSYGSRQQHD